MKKYYLLGLFILIFGGFTMATEVPMVRYHAQFAMNNMHCKISVNGMVATDTVDDGFPPRLRTYGYGIGEYLSEGVNTLAIEARALSKPDEGFGAPFCEIAISAMVDNKALGTTETKKVTMIRITQNQEGNFTTEESESFPEPTVTTPLKQTILTTKFDPEAKVNDILVSRDLILNHPHPFRWNKGAKFINNPENREKLWAEYENMRAILASRDIEQLRPFWKMAIEDRANYEGGGDPNRYFDGVVAELQFKEYLSDPTFKVLDYNRNDYQINIYADGRLVQIVDKKTEGNSPAYFEVEGNKYYFNARFAIIGGKLIPAII